MQPRIRSNLSTGAGFAAIVLWSTTFALARSVSEQLGTFTAAAAVYLAGGVICLLSFLLREQPLSGWRDFSAQYLLGCGGLFVLYSTLIYLAVGLAQNREQLLAVALVNYLWPAGTILLSLLLLRQRANWLLLPGTLLAMTGVYLVMTQGAHVSGSDLAVGKLNRPAALLLALGGAISWALYSNLTRRWAPSGGQGAVELFVPVTGLFLLLLRYCAHEASRWTPKAAIECAVLGAVTALAYTLWDTAMRKGNLLLVAACSYATPLLSTMVSCAYLRIVPGAKLWLGAMLIVAGSMVSWRSVTPAVPGAPLEVAET